MSNVMRVRLVIALVTYRLIIILLSISSLSGVVATETFMYFRTYRKDRLPIKAVVSAFTILPNVAQPQQSIRIHTGSPGLVGTRV